MVVVVVVMLAASRNSLGDVKRIQSRLLESCWGTVGMSLCDMLKQLMECTVEESQNANS